MTRKISSLNIVPLIDILLVLFVVLMVIGRFEDDDLFNRDEVIKELAISISQKDAEIAELNKKIQSIGPDKELLAQNKKMNEELKKLREPVEKINSLEMDYQKKVKALKEENEKLKKEKNEITVVSESIDTYVINGKKMSLDDALFISEVFKGFGLINYQWYKNNQESIQARDIFLQKAKIKPIQ